MSNVIIIVKKNETKLSKQKIIDLLKDKIYLFKSKDVIYVSYSFPKELDNLKYSRYALLPIGKKDFLRIWFENKNLSIQICINVDKIKELIFTVDEVLNQIIIIDFSKLKAV